MSIRFFRSSRALRTWLEKDHAKAAELHVGFYKKASGKPSVTYHEALDEALCFGWIDGVRRSIDGESYTIRFTPRRPGSPWSLVNIKRVTDLKKRGRMRPAGLLAFAHHDVRKARQHSHERLNTDLSPAFQREFRKHADAWDFFQGQPAGYRKLASWHVMTAKRVETRRMRLGTLIEDSAARRRLGVLTAPGRRRSSA